jgi:hypothetical protein
VDGLELGGTDGFYRAVDARMRRRGDAGNLVHLAYELDGPPDRRLLDTRALESAARFPFIGAKLPSWPRIGWTGPGAAMPVVDVEELAADTLLAGLQSTALPTARPVELRVSGRTVVLRFVHTAGDAVGMHAFARWLGGDPSPPGTPVQALSVRRSAVRRGAGFVARAIAVHRLMLRSLPHPGAFRVPADASGDAVSLGDVPAPRALWDRAKAMELPGGATVLFAAATALALARAAQPGRRAHFLMPLPTSPRTQAELGAWFGNAGSGIRVALPVRLLTDLDAAARVLSARWTQGIAGREDVAFDSLFGLARFLPPLLQDALLGGTPQAPMFSYVRLDPPADGRMWGRRVVRTALVGSVPDRAGVGVLFTRSGDALVRVVTARRCSLAPAVATALDEVLGLDT